MMDAPVALGTDHNLPYVFDSFAYRGRIEGDLNTPVLLKNPEPREDELPLERSVVDFGSPEGTRKPLSSPCAECVEGEFSEVRVDGVLRSTEHRGGPGLLLKAPASYA
jgi:hypothetical protein